MIFVLGVKRVTPLTLTQRPQLAQYKDIWLLHPLANYWLSFYNTLPRLFGALCHYKHVKTTVLTSCLTTPPHPPALSWDQRPHKG